jgi:tetratricopeptide (TPR) repeat protein
MVFGSDRKPISDVNVELLDDLGRTIARTRTAAGRYAFYRLSSGRFKVKVLPLGTNYQEQEQEVEIANFRRALPSGGTVQSGLSNEQKDFYLVPRRGAVNSVTGVIFAQTIPEPARKLYDQAITDLENKKDKEALVGLKGAIEIFPEYFAALERLGLEYNRIGLSVEYYDAAAVLLSKAVGVDPRSHTSWYGLAYALYSLKIFDRALESIKKAVELNPSGPQTLLLYGVLLRQDKRYEEAEKQFLKVKELTNENNVEAHWELALLYAHDLKRYKKAAEELRLLLKLRPDAKNADAIRKLIADFEAKAPQD